MNIIDKNLLSDNAYQILKWVVAVLMPACGTAILALGQIFDWNVCNTIVQVLVVIETFLGTVFAISSSTYSKPEDGTTDTDSTGSTTGD